MRVIDADELMSKVNRIKYLRHIKAKKLIDECKEIEAIPTDWIEKWIGRHNLSDTDALCINAMIYEWRKENE